MELENHTPFPAMLFRGVIAGERLCASVFARVTYDLADGRLTEAAEQAWPVSPAPWDSDYGPREGDEVFYKGGVDLFVFGSARPERGREVPRCEVRIQVGREFRKRVLVFGDRVWQRSHGQLVPSDPKPFREISLTPAHAFGGKDVWDELELPFQDNPEGKGFYFEEANAIGKPLPNLEDPERLIRRWDDRPDPVGLVPCPATSGLRMRDRMVIDEKKRIITELRPTFCNVAFPDMIVPHVDPGDEVVLEGVHEGGPVRFVIPPNRLFTRLRFEPEVIERPLKIDELAIEVDKRRVCIGYRYPFRYTLYPLQRRSCELLLRE